MINTSDAYKTAIVADARRMRIKCIVDLVGPDIVYGPPVYSAAAPWTKPKELYNKIMDSEERNATLEHNRWILDGTYDIYPDNYAVNDETGVVCDAMSGEDGYFETPQYVELRFSQVYVLQMCSIWFSVNDDDGVPLDFTVEVYSGGTAYYTETVTGNTESTVYFEGFTVYRPDAIRLTVTRMSSPSRRLRVLEIIPGYYEEWTENDLAEFNLTQQAAFSNLSLPYATCTLKMDNLNRRFEPRKKGSIFQSLTERQAITTFIGVDTPEGTEYVCTGVFYQYDHGWGTSDNDIAMVWRLVDIVGLVNNREFRLNDSLPTTLGGWVKALTMQLGDNFEYRYSVDPNYAELPCTVNDIKDVTGKKCGQILLWICQATETWPRADAETGQLTIEPFWNQGVVFALDNLERYPTMSANNDIARLDFTVTENVENEDGDTEEQDVIYSYLGTNAAAPRGANISNPFIHDEKAAVKAARMMLAAYGGNLIETTGRGDPSSEIGDVATVQLDESSATTGRVLFQSFQFRDGVLRGCKTQMLQADGAYLFQERVLLTGSGTWTAPAGVTQLRIILGQGGHGGGNGTDGVLGYGDEFSRFEPAEDGEDGADGDGGAIYYLDIGVNPGERFSYSCGAGGASGGGVGEHSRFGEYTSADGEIYPNGFTDIGGGESYGRTGVEEPLPNSSDGGKGGKGGEAGYKHVVNLGRPDDNPSSWLGGYDEIDKEATPGEPGAAGGSGFILLYYDKPNSEVSA